jgi:acyl-CoA thioester hydrolase
MKSERIYIVQQQMFNESNELCSEAVFTGALFDLKKRKIIPPTEIWLKAIGF